MPVSHKDLRRVNARFLSVVMFAFFFILVSAHTTNAELLLVSVSKARVRHGPGAEFATLWQATQGYPLKLVESKGEWFHIQDLEGDKGWIHKSVVQKADVVVVSGKILNVRKGPGTTYPVVMKCERGVVLRKLDQKKGWIKVKHADGEVGYVFANLVWQ